MQFTAQPGSENHHDTGHVSHSKNPMDKVFGKRGWPFYGFILGVLVIGLQVFMILLIINPGLFFKNDTQMVIGEVAKLTTINLGENPTVAVISDAKKLRDENEIQAKVYKDAQNGDYVLGYTDKMIIYRKSEGKIIYEGSSPGKILQDSRSALVAAIDKKAKELKIISESSKESVQATIVTDPADFKKQNSKFYADLRKDDVVGVYNDAQIIVIYRQDTGSIVKSGKFGVDISNL